MKNVKPSSRFILAEKIEINVLMNKELGTGLPQVNRNYIGKNVFFRDGCDYGFFENGRHIYTDGSSHGETEEIAFDTKVKDKKDIPVLTTLLGDADMGGIVELADLTTVAKYNLNNEAYPLANDTAYANADMNGDGIVDALDTSALIEDQLGKK